MRYDRLRVKISKKQRGRGSITSEVVTHILKIMPSADNYEKRGGMCITSRLMPYHAVAVVYQMSSKMVSNAPLLECGEKASMADLDGMRMFGSFRALMRFVNTS